MKKNLLTIALVAGALLPASAQWYQVGGTVKVKPNTLKYVSGDQKISGGKESNEGMVNVRGNFTVDEGVDKEFRNEFTSPTEYGQLIIADASESTGKVVGEYKTPGESRFYTAILSIPYVDVTADQIADAAGVINKEWANHPGNKVFNANRWKNPVNVWDNAIYALRDLKETEQITVDGNNKPTNYYTVYNKGLQFRETNYAGRPANMAHSVALTPFRVDGRTNYKRNLYGEVLGSYLIDPFVPTPAGWEQKGDGPTDRTPGYGDNYFYLGNPYTSNVDLTGVLNDENIIGVVQYTGLQYTEGVGSNEDRNSFPEKAVKNGSSWGGDTNVFKLRPYHAFGVKTSGKLVNLTLDDSVKTFTEDANAPKYNSRVSRNSDLLKQVKVKLTTSDKFELARTYIVASSYFKASGEVGNQAYVPELPSNLDGIYTLEENEDGTILADGGKLYINGINDIDYVGKPVHLVHQVATPGTFIFSFDLSDGVRGGNKFYFEDKETGDVKEISSNFTYTFNASESSTDRFRIYWNDKPVTEALATNDVISQETVVYRDNTNTYKVRFANGLKSADVYVYNVLGQLVHSKNTVNTVVDYVLPLDNSSAAYVVKIVGDNGVVTTKKIVK